MILRRMAEVVRRRYTRVLKESKSEVRSPKSEKSPKAEERVARRACGRRRSRPPAPISHSALRTPHSALPDLILIDGGKGQLGAACAELEKLGLGHIPTIGLAKEFEEIYRPGEKEPLRLSHESGALKLLQRVRDESHRFANTYNAQLRLRKISESILDEFPNIGERRKAALLKKFGSVQRLRLATVEQIAEVPGFGGKAAAELKAFLEARSAEERRWLDFLASPWPSIPPGLIMHRQLSALVLGLLLLPLGLPLSGLAQSAAFTYQGRLLDGGQPANGSYDFQFALADALTGGNRVGPALTNAPVSVSNGLFVVVVDFGSGAFDGSARWLEIGVRTNGSAALTPP